MKRLNWAMTVLCTSVLLLAAAGDGLAADAPPDVASALIIKLVALEKSLVGVGGDIVIHVMGSPAIAEALNKAVGISIGKGKLAKVTGGDAIPAEKPTVLCLADATKVAEVTAYTRKEKVLSVTNLPDLVGKGISLGIGVGDSGKPEVTLNITASKAEGLDWNPAIMKIAKTVK